MTMTQKTLLGSATVGLLGAALGAGVTLQFAPGRKGAVPETLAADVTRLQSAVEAQADRIGRLETALASAGAPDRARPPTGGQSSAPVDREGAMATDRPSTSPAPIEKGRAVLAELKEITDGSRETAIREALKELANIGDPIVPDIAAVLDSGLERRYVEGKPLLQHVKGYVGLRMVLQCALREIGTPAARKALFQSVGKSKRVADFRDLMYPYMSTTDPAFVEGISDLVPDALATLAESGIVGDDGEAMDLIWSIQASLRRKDVPGVAESVEKVLLKFPAYPDGSSRMACDELFKMLLESAPERAAQVALELRSRGGKEDPLAALTTSLRYSVPLAQQARYYGVIFTKGDIASDLRRGLYWAMPDGPASTVKDPAKRAEDAAAFLSFLEGRLDVENEEGVKTVLQKKLERFRANLSK